MDYVLNYSKWRSIYEEAETSIFKVSISDLWSKISDKLKKKYSRDPEELLNAAKSGLSIARAASIDLPEEPIQPTVPNDIVATNPNSNLAERLNESTDWEYWIDVAIDVLGGVLDGIPLGVTQVASMITDILHTISYALRWYFSNDENSKIKYLIMTFIGIAGAFVPLGGNMMNISAMNKISKVLSVSPKAIAKLGYTLVGKKLPFPHWSTFAKWKIKFVYVFIKLVGEVGLSILEKIAGFFSRMFNGLSKYLTAWIKSSPFTGWIMSDYILPVINETRSMVEGISKMTGLDQIAKA